MLEWFSFSFRRQQDILTHPLTPFFSQNLVETHFCLVGLVSVCFSNIHSQVWARMCVSPLAGCRLHLPEQGRAGGEGRSVKEAAGAAEMCV